MNVSSVLAAGLNLDFDYEKIKSEMLALRPHWVYTPPYKTHIDNGLAGVVYRSESVDLYNKIDYIDSGVSHVQRELRGQHIFYLRYSKDNPDAQKFLITKNLPTDNWEWIDRYKNTIPYTINCIESLPYKKIGCIRVFVTENTFFPSHRDYGMHGPFELSTDYSKTLGLSIIPDTGNVPMSIYSFQHKQVHKVHGNAMIFNDSAFHGVEFTPGIRITIRIFGEIDFQELLPFVDSERICY